jgi:hypothetical protein
MSSSFNQIQSSKIAPTFCSACGGEIPCGALVCASCAKPVTATGSQTPTEVSKLVPSFVRASGRSRKAGYWIFGGGIATALSAFFPWVSLDGMESTHPSGGGAILLLAVGGLLAYFGSRVLQDRITKRASITLWVLAAIDVVLVVMLFAAVASVNHQVGGGVEPSSGFLIGIAGLIAGVAGTVLVHTVRRQKEAAALASNDGHSSVAGV